jgi:hypothetical protein
MQKNTVTAGQSRHGTGHIAAVLVGMGLAEADQIEAIQQVLTMIGMTPEFQVALGAIVIAAVHLLSAWSKRRPQ